MDSLIVVAGSFVSIVACYAVDRYTAWRADRKRIRRRIGLD